MTEYTFQGTVTIDGVQHVVTADGILAQVVPVGGGGGTTTGGGGTTGGGTTGGGTTGGGGTSTGGGGTTGGGTTGGGTTGGGGTTPANQCYFGVWDPSTVNWNTPDGNPVGTWDGVTKFGGAPVKSATYFAAWLSPFPTVLDQLAASHGDTVYLNLEPQNTWGGLPNPSFTDIAKGSADSYLTSIGNAIKAGGIDMWVTFAHEMNGNGWYPWQQSGGVSPAQWVTTYKHVCDVIRAAAGGRAKMVWCPNNIDVGSSKDYYPGPSYVDIHAFDGYLNENSPTLTYGNFVAQTVAEIRDIAGDVPIWNAETGVYDFPNRAARYAQFIADMHSDGLLGFTQWNEGHYALNSAEIAAVTAAVNKWNAGA